MSSFFIANESAGRWIVVLNGVDITKMIADGGVQVQCREHGLPPLVHLTLCPQEVHVDLPEAIVSVEERVA